MSYDIEYLYNKMLVLVEQSPNFSNEPYSTDSIDDIVTPVQRDPNMLLLACQDWDMNILPPYHIDSVVMMLTKKRDIILVDNTDSIFDIFE